MGAGRSVVAMTSLSILRHSLLLALGVLGGVPLHSMKSALDGSMTGR
jgi:hypothetical protein